MKRLKPALALLCTLALLLCLPAPALAAGPLNQIKDAGADGAQTAPAASDILNTEGGDKVQLPGAASYYSSFVPGYIDAEGQHSVYVYKRPQAASGEQQPYAFHGSRVLVLAEEGGLSCVLYHDKDNVRRAGWVFSDYITPKYPGQTLSLNAGGASLLDTLAAEEPEVSWSREPFVGTKQKYTLLDTPAENCTRFTLDYQVTARNGAETNEVLGPRSVYVNAGDGWVKVGSFAYDKLGSVHVEVRLDAPLTLVAVATEADCGKPDTFQFRQSLLDVYTLA